MSTPSERDVHDESGSPEVAEGAPPEVVEEGARTTRDETAGVYTGKEGLRKIRKALKEYKFDGDRFGVRREPMPGSRNARRLEVKSEMRNKREVVQ